MLPSGLCSSASSPTLFLNSAFASGESMLTSVPELSISSGPIILMRFNLSSSSNSVTQAPNTMTLVFSGICSMILMSSKRLARKRTLRSISRRSRLPSVYSALSDLSPCAAASLTD